MKRTSALNRFAQLLVIGVFNCATSPVLAEIIGWETLTAQPGNFSLFGLRLLNPALVAGLTEISGTTITDTEVDFDEALDPPPARYQVEFNDGASVGKVIEIVSFAANTLTVAEPLPTETDVTYRVRAIPKLSEIISPLEPMATTDFNPDNADLILLPSGGGKFNQYYVSSYENALHPEYFNKYINAATGLPEDPFLHYPDGFFYLRRDSSALNLIFAGAVKTASTLLSVTDTINYFSSVYPYDETLAESDLAASLQAGTAQTADLVWIQDASGNYRSYFHSNGTPPLTAGWRLVNADPGFEDADQSGVELSPGFIIHRRAPAPYNALMTPPDYYSSL